jgi:hypothetical protein
VEGEMFTPWEIRAGLSQNSVLFTILNNMYLNDAPQTSDIYLALFADDSCTYVTNREEGFVARKRQRGLSSPETCCERWNIKTNEDKTQGIFYSRSPRPPESHLTLNGRTTL